MSWIDTEKWDAARWKGVAFLLDPTGMSAPCLGLVFQNIQAARQIFSDWIARLGSRDGLDELRIAVIEGAIGGENPGYSVHFSASTGEGHRANSGRVCRMTPAPGSTHLAQFKADLEAHRHYTLVAVSTGIEPQFDCAVEKVEIHFRRVADITRWDIDAVALPGSFFD